MKKTLFCFLLLSGFNCLAVDVGSYTCQYSDPESTKESGGFQIQITNDTIKDISAGTEYFLSEPENSKMVELKMLYDEFDHEREYFRYYIYRQDSDVLIGRTQEKYYGESEINGNVTMTKISSDKFKINYVIHNVDGSSESIEQICQKDFDLISRIENKQTSVF